MVMEDKFKPMAPITKACGEMLSLTVMAKLSTQMERSKMEFGIKVNFKID